MERSVYRAVGLAASVLILGGTAESGSRAELDAAAQQMGLRPASAPAAVPVGAPVAAPDAPGLFWRGRRIGADDWKAHRTALDVLTERFLAEVRPPFILPAGRQVVTGQDDLAYVFERGGTLTIDLSPAERTALGAPFVVRQPHEALDVASRVSADGGRTLETLKDAAVYPIHPRGRVELRHGGAYVAQRVRLEQGAYRLILDIIYAHVAPAAGTLGPDKPLGRLEGDDRWGSADPALTRILPYKGNHVHLLIRGVNDLEKRHYVELSRPGARDPALLDYVGYRADFYNKRLLPKVSGGR